MRSGPVTLAIDCGGTGLKACRLDPDGEMIGDRVRVRTPYPCPPPVLVATLVELVAPLGTFDRVSVGFPGLVRQGRVRATPHYVTTAGPFTPVRPDLLEAWSGFDVTAALQSAFGRPVRVVNDAEVQGLAVVAGEGYEVVLTLGTGLGFAHFEDGRLLPKVELSQHPWRKGETYDERLGDLARRRVGDTKWSRRVLAAVSTLRPVLGWDRLYLGGGALKHLTPDALATLQAQARIVDNRAGLLGGVRLWSDAGAQRMGITLVRR